MSRELAIKLVEELQGLYDQPGRYYHNFKHILQVISFLKENLDKINTPRVVFWATLYHDIIYDTHSKFGQNEKDSAEYATSELSDKLSEEELKQITLYIEATIRHNIDLNDNDLYLFLDADISILGAEPEIYDNYAVNIRKEYSWAQDGQYANARIEILQDFLNRERIYTTEIAHDTLESQARINISNEIKRLS